MLAIRIVYRKTDLKGFVYLVVLNVPVLVCKHISKPDCGDESVSRLPVDHSLTIKYSNCAFGCRPVESELP